MEWNHPRSLHRGDLIGVCAPSGVAGLDRLRRGVLGLEALGFSVRVAEDAVTSRAGFTAGSIDRRLAELHSLFADPDVAGIVCARGGAGAGQLLPGLDESLLRRHPKLFVGYSDATFLHLFLNRLGVVSIHGPMIATDFDDGHFDRPSLVQALAGEGPLYATNTDDLMPLRPGFAEGRLRGGCLSILAAAAGTRWALQADEQGTLLFLEDSDERPYRIDRMLLQLRLSGAFSGVRGIVLGEMKGCRPRLDASHASEVSGHSLEDVILDALAGLDIPIAIGLSSGHTSGPNVALPLGVRARLAVSDVAHFEVLEPAVT